MDGLVSFHEPQQGTPLAAGDWKKLVGKNIKRLVQREGKSLKGLAGYLGISQPQMSKYSQGHQLPAKYLDKIVEYLECEYRDLFETDPLAPVPPPKRPSLDEAFNILAEELGYLVNQKGEKDS